MLGSRIPNDSWAHSVPLITGCRGWAADHRRTVSSARSQMERFPRRSFCGRASKPRASSGRFQRTSRAPRDERNALELRIRKLAARFDPDAQDYPVQRAMELAVREADQWSEQPSTSRRRHCRTRSGRERLIQILGVLQAQTRLYGGGPTRLTVASIERTKPGTLPRSGHHAVRQLGSLPSVVSAGERRGPRGHRDSKLYDVSPRRRTRASGGGASGSVLDRQRTILSLGQGSLRPSPGRGDPGPFNRKRFEVP